MEIFSLDLGNKQSKLKSSAGEKVLPSQILDAADLPQHVSSLSKESELHQFVVPFDERKWVWGESLSSLHLDDYLQDTLMYQNRYSTANYKLLANFALGLLATDFPDSKENVKDVVVVAGLPTEDYQNKTQIESLNDVLRGQHQVEVDGQLYTIRVKKVYIVPQPVGTLYDQILDDKGFVQNESLLSEKAAVVDVGGGTLLIDTLLNFNLDSRNRKQYDTGVNDLYQAVASEMPGNVSLYRLEKALRLSTSNQKYAYAFSKNDIHDITTLVSKQIDRFTQRLVSNIQSTIKDFNSLDTLLITGGGANLVNQKILTTAFPNCLIVADPELANVRGFYKYALSEESKVTDHE